MFCQNCGTEVKEGVKFCPNCGGATSGEQNQSANQQVPTSARLSHTSSVGVYEFLDTLEPNLDFIWADTSSMVSGLLGVFATAMVKTYILAFNSKSIYFCQYASLRGQDIANITKYDWSEIKSFTASKSFVGKSLKFDTKYGERKFRTQKIFWAENQGDKIEKLLKLQK